MWYPSEQYHYEMSDECSLLCSILNAAGQLRLWWYLYVTLRHLPDLWAALGSSTVRPTPVCFTQHQQQPASTATNSTLAHMYTSSFTCRHMSAQFHSTESVAQSSQETIRLINLCPISLGQQACKAHTQTRPPLSLDRPNSCNSSSRCKANAAHSASCCRPWHVSQNK